MPKKAAVAELPDVEVPAGADPIVRVIGAGGGAGVTTLATMMGPMATEASNQIIEDAPYEDESPWLIICASQSASHAAKAVAMRDTALKNSWRVAAIATTGANKIPKAVTSRLNVISDDPVDTVVVRVPYWARAAELAAEELPVWDTQRQGKKTRRADGVPRSIAGLFTQIMDYILTEETADDVFDVGEDHRISDHDADEFDGLGDNA